MRPPPLSALILALLPLTAAAEPDLSRPPRGIGLGVVLGDPTGISFAFRESDAGLIQAAAGWSTVHERLHLNVDYLRNLTFLTSPETPRMRFPVYLGLGGRLRTGDGGSGKHDDDDHSEAGIGVRVPVGITLLPKDRPFDAFFEIVPVVELLPATGLGVDAGLGGRYYF